MSLFFRLSFLLICLSSSTFSAKIAVVSYVDSPSYKERVKWGLKANTEYCEKNGYDFLLFEERLDPSRSAGWSKYLHIQNLLEDSDYEWVVWVDADTIIMNLDIPLEWFCDDQYDFIISRDFNYLNAGVMLFKNSEWSKAFLKAIYRNIDHINHVWPEEATILSIIEKTPFKERAKVVPQRLFNSYTEEVIAKPPNTKTKVHYEPGDFLIHFAGSNLLIGEENLDPLMRAYYLLRIDNRELITLDHFLEIYGFFLDYPHSANNEGYISPLQKNYYQSRLAQMPHIESIAEIGLNGGHSCENFFQQCSNLKHFTSFDINQHPYTEPAIEYFKMKYGDRFEFVEGSSHYTLPLYTATHPETTFDLIYIDGDHSYEGCKQDILDCRPLAHENTLVWIDDCGWGSTVESAVLELIELGEIEILHSNCSGDRIWVEARYCQ